MAQPLAPTAKSCLPQVLAILGTGGDFEPLLGHELLLHAFACGHLLGAQELMEAARQVSPQRLAQAIGGIQEADLARALDSLNKRSCF